MSDTDLVRFRAAVAGGLAHLESRRQEVNDLNVFPVADGDTGDNMALTLRAVLDELDRLQGSDERRTIDEIGREEIVESVARAALLGARGNSGVILSQLIRGAAEELVSRPGQLIDATLIGAALGNAANRAYSSVREPAEGTILTAVREMAQKVVTDVAHSAGDVRLDPGAGSDVQDGVIADALERAVAAGQESVKRGPELLAPLREAAVVDAGGYGLTIVLAGVVAALRGDEAPPLEHHAAARITHPEHSSSTYRFCTNFAVTGAGLSPRRFAAPLERLGDSVLVVGDARTLKVHLHTDEPELATAVFADAGTVSRLDVADMRLQVAERDGRLSGGLAHHDAPVGENGYGRGAPSAAPALAAASSTARDADSLGAMTLAPAPRRPGGGARAAAPVGRCGAVAVVSGSGLTEMFRELGVRTIDGGATFNPSTYDLLAAIHDVPAEEVVVLANNPNVTMGAERAAELSDKQVLVVATASQQAGLAAALALRPDAALEENARALTEALARVRTGAVAPAARADAQGRFAEGDAIGLIEDELIAWGEPRVTLQAVLRALVASGPGSARPELVSVLAGERAPIDLAEVESMLDGAVEVELRHGGQPAYWWLIAAE
jgi:fatty acid kinase